MVIGRAEVEAFFAGMVCNRAKQFYSEDWEESLCVELQAIRLDDAVLVTFVGGLGTVVGPLLGAIFFVVIRDVLATNLTNFHQIIFGVLFILVVLVLPGGLMELWDRLQAKLPDRFKK